MAFKIPFLDKDSDTIEDVKAKGNALLNTAFGLGPLAFASYQSVNTMKSNNPNFLSRLPTNQMGDIHSKVGESFDRYQMVRSQVRDVAKQNALKRFKNVDEFISRLATKQAEEQTAFLASLKTILADPNISDSTGALMKDVERLLQESFGGSLNLTEDSESLKRIISEIVDSETAGSNRVSKISGYASSPFHPVSDLLVQPQKLNLSGIKPNLTEVPVGSDLMNRYKNTKVFDMLERAFSGTGVEFRFSARKETVGSLSGNVPYVEIFNQGRRLQSLPLDLGAFNTAGIFPVRYGNMNTMYAGSGAYANASVLNEIAQIKDIKARRVALNKAMTQGLFMRPEEAIAQMFITNVTNRGGIHRVSSRDLSLINQNIQQSLEFIDRFPVAGTGGGISPINEFLEQKYKQTGHSLKIINPMQLSASEQRELRPMLSQVMDMIGFSANPFTSGNFGQSMGDIGLRSAFLQNMYGNTHGDGVIETAQRQFGGLLTNRATQPITARFRQMYNREEFLKQRNPGFNFYEGGLELEKPRGIAVMDVLSGSREGAEDTFNLGRNIFGIGEGTANYFGETVVTKAVNKPVYDPGQFGGASNILFEELKFRVATGDDSVRNINIGTKRNQAGEFVTSFFGSVIKEGETRHTSEAVGDLIRKRGLEGRVRMESNQLIYSDINDFFKLFGAKQDNFGLYLGMIDGRRQYLPRYSGLEGVAFGLTEELDSEGRGLRKYSITGFRDTDNPFMKIFSTMFKGTVEKTDEATMRRTLTGRAGISDDLVSTIIGKQTQGSVSGIFTSDAAMLKKASMNIAEQIGGSLDVFGIMNKTDFDISLQNLIMDTNRGGMGLEAFESLSVNDQNNVLLKNAIKLATREYANKSGGRFMTSEMIEMQGLTFGYFAKSIFGGKVQGVTGEDFEGLIRETHKELGFAVDQDDVYESYIEKLKKQVSKGVAVGLTNMEIGPQSSSLGQNMGSIEPRLYNFLSYKLTHEMGIERDKVSNFMFSILSRKKTTGEDIALAKEYAMAMDSFSNRSLMEKDITRVSVDEFVQNTSDQQMRKFLASQDGGFLLDFSGDANLTNRIASSGVPSQIYLPGGEGFLDLLERERTLIPTDDAFREIDADYIKTLTRFSKSLMQVSTTQSNAEAIGNALRGIDDFKDAMSEFFGISFRRTLRGKMSGSTFALGGTVDTGRFSDEFLGLRINQTTGAIEELGSGAKGFMRGAGGYVFGSEMSGQKKIDVFSDFASSIAPEDYRAYVDAKKEAKNRRKSKGERAAAEKAAQGIVDNFVVTEKQMQGYLRQSLGSVNYTEQEKYLMRKIQRSTMGHAVFQDSTSFLNAMSTFMSGVNAEYVMQDAVKKGVDPKQAVKNARRKSRQATRDALQYFFLGSYDQSKPSLANIAVASRHPVVGSAHVEFVGAFRDLREVRKGQDKVFERFSRTEAGMRVIQNFEDLTGRKIKGFKTLLDFLQQGSRTGDTGVYRASDEHILQYLKNTNLNEIDEINERLLSVTDPVDRDEMKKTIAGLQDTNVRLDSAIAGNRTGEFSESIKEVRGQIAKPSDRRKLVNRFFDAVLNHMGDISPGVGGGRVAIPQFMVDVHFGGKTERLDLSLAGGMIGDFDGDIYQLLYPTRSNLTEKGINLIGNKGRANLEKIAKEKLLYRAKTRAIFSMAGDGISNLAKSMGDTDRTLIQEIAVKARQEQLGKNVGPIDVSFDALRLGIINTADESTRGVASDALNLLAAIQEVAVIKAKKLPTDMPLADALSRNINLAIEGDVAAFDTVETLFRDYFFRGVDLKTEFGETRAVGGGIDVLSEALEGQRVLHMFAPGGTSSADDATTYIMPYLRSLLSHIKEAGYLHSKTERRLSLASRQEISAMNEVFQGLLRDNVQGQLMGIGSEQTTMNDLEQLHRNITGLLRTNAVEIGSKGRMGSLGIGLAATMALGSALGYGGYDPTPLSVEGEIVSPELRAAIREGNAFEAGPSQEAVQDMQNSIQSDIMNRQINIGQMLADSPGGFHMKGQAQNMRAVSELSYIVGAMGGQSHFTINDTRSPISENFIRRKYFGD